MAEYTLIAEHDALARACDRWKHARWIALDTEFVREDTYYPKLCLIQVADGSEVAVIDALALGDALAGLRETLAAPGVLKVIHAASQDLEVLHLMCGRTPAPILDTQIAAAMLGLGDQISYAALVSKRLGLTLDKSLTRTDWSRRPLSAAEIDYAADDVRHLAELFPALEAELEARGRHEWLAEECLALCDPARYEVRPDQAWKRLKGIGGLPAAAQGAAAALAAWRETVAQRRDRPRRWILPDDAVMAIAQRRPRTVEELERLQMLPPKTLAREGASLLSLLDSLPPNPTPVASASVPLTDPQKKELADWQARVRGLAEELGIPPPMLASRAELEALVRSGPDGAQALRRGWRGRVSSPLFAG